MLRSNSVATTLIPSAPAIYRLVLILLAALIGSLPAHAVCAERSTARQLDCLAYELASLQTTVGSLERELLLTETELLTTQQSLAEAEERIWVLESAGLATETWVEASFVGAFDEHWLQARTLLGHVDVSTPDEVRFVGANLYIQSGSGATNGAVNGLGNLIIGYNEDPQYSGVPNRDGSHNLIIGTGHEYASHSGIVTGGSSRLYGPGAAAVGGTSNIAYDESSIFGSRGSQAYAVTTIVGGIGNEAQPGYNTVVGGYGNVANGDHNTITGGYQNEVYGSYNGVYGGYLNEAGGEYSTITGGSSNLAEGRWTAIVGGKENGDDWLSESVAILGGQGNDATTRMSTIVGGQGNITSLYRPSLPSFEYSSWEDEGEYAVVVGGVTNTAQSNYGVILGGESNVARGNISAIVGGADNLTSPDYWNNADAIYSVLVGGQGNTLEGNGSYVQTWLGGEAIYLETSPRTVTSTP